MKSYFKLVGSGTAALFVATLALQAQSTSSQQQTTPDRSSSSSSAEVSTSTTPDDRYPSSTPSASAQSGTSAGTTSGASSSSMTGSTSTSTEAPPGTVSGSSTGSTSPSGTSTTSPSGSSTSQSGVVSGSTSGSVSGSTSSSTSSSTSLPPSQDGGLSTTTQSGTQQSGTSQTGSIDTRSTFGSSATTSFQQDTQVTTIVQQIDAQGPAVVERITTQIADVACNAENARMLVDALRNGTAVTLTAEGKTATFTPTTSLGYGEAYIALALAAEALRNAGVTGCATPDQWEAVLMGGPLAASGTTSTSTSTSASSSSSSEFPGILKLRSEGQGWGQVAQRTNVQLGQVVSKARSSLNLSTSASDSLSPTGRTSDELDSSSSTDSSPSTHKMDSSTSSGAMDSSSSSDSSMHPGKGKAKGKDHSKGRWSDDEDSPSSRGKSGSTPPSSTPSSNR